MQRRINTLAIDVTKNSLAYAVFYGSDMLLDWGRTYTDGRYTKHFVAKADKLFSRFKPELLVIEDLECARRGWRAARRIEAINNRALELDIAVLPAPRPAIKKTFEKTGTTKHEIAFAIAKKFPELRSKLPPKHRFTFAEDERMHVFDALSFALTVLYELEST